MKKFIDMIYPVVGRINNKFSVLPLQMKVWNNLMTANSLDRYLYLALHKSRLMGNEAQKVVSSIVGKNMTVVDAGANIGLYTGLLSSLVGSAGKVISVEPDPDNCAALRAAVEANRWANVECHCCALHDKQDSLLLVRDPCNSGNHALANGPLLPEAGSLNTVEGRSLDEVVGERLVDFVKIDVQGWELRVLQGAQKILASGAPLSLLVELWPQGLQRNGSSAQEVLELLESFSFRLLDPADGCLIKAPPTHGYQDVLAVRH
jgi:FkbM family methyltransferase